MERNMFEYLIDMFTKANSLLNVVNQESFNIFHEYKKIESVEKPKDKEVKAKKVEEFEQKHSDKLVQKRPFMDKLKYLEMQLNKKDMLLEKAKLICIKLDKIFLIVPYTVSRIEQRMRNVMINNRHILDGISHFMNFYLINLQFKVHI